MAEPIEPAASDEEQLPIAPGEAADAEKSAVAVSRAACGPFPAGMNAEPAMLLARLQASQPQAAPTERAAKGEDEPGDGCGAAADEGATREAEGQGSDDNGMDAADRELASKMKEWVSQLMDNEVARVQACGQKVLRLPVKNCSILRKAKGEVINRVEVDCTMDFDCVHHILLSEPMPCPLEEKRGFSMVFVVLDTGKPMVPILPYIYDTSVVDNTLQDWHFVNSKLKTSHHRISRMEETSGLEPVMEDALEAQDAPKPKGRRVPARPSRKKR